VGVLYEVTEDGERLAPELELLVVLPETLGIKVQSKRRK
jgi:hypothetical protein